jgi:predicted ATPase
MGAAQYPFTVPALQGGIDLPFPSPVTFLVGENGSGKSTLLEAIAECCGFNPEGGSRDHQRSADAEPSALASALRLAWLPKVSEGFFLRAESFFNFATYLDGVSTLELYGGRSLHAQSHGESFLTLFANRFSQGLFLLDEPEAALSPQRQLSFLRVIHDLTTSGRGQFIIATHSPILLAFPGATLYSFSDEGIRPIAFSDCEHVQLTRNFLNAPDRFLSVLFEADPQP